MLPMFFSHGTPTTAPALAPRLFPVVEPILPPLPEQLPIAKNHDIQIMG